METPMCNKLREVSDDSQKIGEFLEWMNGKGYWIGKYGRYTDPETEEEEGEEELIPIKKSTEELLADYFEIDLNQVEKERRAILEEIRKK